MTVDLSKGIRNSSIFLPSISAVYSHHASKHITLENSPRQGEHPEGFPSSKNLDFLDPNQGKFFYNHALFSAGHAFLNIEKSDEKEAMVQKRDRSKTWILGDSGGFQIGKGVIDFDFKDFQGSKSNSVREKILRWLEHTTDYSMILDIPPWAIGYQPGITDFESCLNGTLFNNDYFLRNRTGDCYFLNVLQGRTNEEMNFWYEQVKDYPFEGWAFAGNYTTDYEQALLRIIQMRDEGAFMENSNGIKRNWLHFLGQSRLTLAVALTDIMQHLREQHNDPELNVSFDSASPFIASARGGCYTKEIFNKKQFAYLMEKMWDNHDLIGSDLPFPWPSTVGESLKMGDICVRPKNWDEKDIKTSWDTYSYILLMCHNVEKHVRATQQANTIYKLPHDTTGQLYMPTKLIKFREVVNEVFNSETPYDVIKRNSRFLRTFGGYKHVKNFGAPSTVGKFFDYEEDEQDYFNQDEIDFENTDDEKLNNLEEN